jgi:hypothetical protein
MAEVRIQSVSDPFDTPELMRSILEAIVLIEAMGLLEGSDVVEALDLATLRRVVERASRAGIAPGAAAVIERLSNRRVHDRGIDQSDLRDLREAIQRLRDALEQSPVPEFEWGSMLEVFEADELASLVGTSLSSLRRYASGSRATPDDVAARLHFLARVVGELKGSYNQIGIRRWFRRKRLPLRERAPAELLRGSWAPEDPGPAEVLALARSLVSSPAT